MYSISFAARPLTGAVAMAIWLVAGCGGGAGDVQESVAGPAATGHVAGVVTKGPLGGATVTAYGITNSQQGARLGTAATDAGGNFRMAIGAYAGPLMLQVSGGSYVDEATNASVTMAAGDMMTAVLPSLVAGSDTGGIQVTPLTGMAQAMAQQMRGGMTDANIAAANTAVGMYFMVSDIIHVQPMNPLVAGAAGNATPDAQHYGMTLAAMSKWAQLQGMTGSSAMVTAMMNDASDGLFDGRKSATPITMPLGGMMGSAVMMPTAGTSDLGSAMFDFMNSAMNRSGLKPSDMAGLMQKLNSASGKLWPAA